MNQVYPEYYAQEEVTTNKIFMLFLNILFGIVLLLGWLVGRMAKRSDKPYEM